MSNTINIQALLKPLFDSYEVAMVPADQDCLRVFKVRATERKVPDLVIAELTEFYSIVNGVPCLNSLNIHSCEDLIIFEWWEDKELWLGQRDFYTLRWSKDRYCIGDAVNVSFDSSDEHLNFAAAIRQFVELYESSETA